MSMTAADLYGGAPSAQPTPTATADHAPGTPEPMARTLPRTASSALKSPTLVLVLLLAVAAALVQVSVRGSISVSA